MKSSNILIIVGVVAVAAATAFSVAAYAEMTGTEEFVHKASIANKFEIETSKVALEKTGNEDVKSFAQRMIAEHKETGEKLAATLKESGTKAKVESKLDDKHQRMLDELKETQAADFDKTYIDMQTKAHEQAVKLFTDYSQHGKDAKLRNFASNTLPDLADHLKHIPEVK